MRPANLIVFIFSVTTLLSCDTDQSNSIELDKICEDPRPVVCAMDYRPVCGMNEKGSIMKTYSNGCSACADKDVFGYVDEECRR